jgi:hypothetical protein
MNMTIQTSQIADGPTLHTVNFNQSFNLVGEASSSGSFSFYYTTPVTSAPNNVILSSFGIASTNFKKISGINVLYSNPQITIDCNASNMGTYFYRTPLLTYTCKLTNSSGTTVATYNESDLSKVTKSLYYPDNVLKPTIGFNSIFNTNSLVSSYATQLYLSVVANNIFGSSNSVGITQNVIVDGPSNTLVSTLAQSIPTLGTNTAGYRVWSAPSFSNNCPYLTKDNNGTTYYRSIQYNNEWDITSTSTTIGSYNATTELLVSNGLFRTKGTAGSSAGYLDYTNSLYNSTIDYSGIPASGLRFATFCWKLGEKISGYSNLSFTINSIFSPSKNGDGLLTMNNRQIQALYFFQDESSSIFSSSVFNSVWIDGNSTSNIGANLSNYFDTDNPYSYYNGIDTRQGKGVVISGTTATINVFIPTNGVNNTTYLYLRLAIPMDVSISFGNVTATIS